MQFWFYVRQMSRMFSINLDILGLLENRHKAHIVALATVRRRRQRRVGLELDQAWDLTDHGFGLGRPFGELGGCYAWFELE